MLRAYFMAAKAVTLSTTKLEHIVFSFQLVMFREKDAIRKSVLTV